VTADIRYEVVAEAADGMRIEPPASHRVRVQADEKPTVRFVEPSESYAATPTTEVPLRVEAGDDHGLSKVGVSFRVGDGPEESLYLDDPKGTPATVEAMAMLYLEKHGLSFTDSLTYRAFAEDNRPDRPRKASTELRSIDILPYKQAFQITEGGGRSDGTSVTLEELIARQRQALNRAFAHADDGTVEAGVADRLSKDEAQIGLATREFAEGLATRFGAVPPLEQAAQAMQAATIALAEKDLATAVPLEQTALAALIQARQDLRKLLGHSSSSGQCRKFDRQQEQKLRKPPSVEEKPREAELARTLGALKGGESAIRRASASLTDAARSPVGNAWAPPSRGGAQEGIFQPPQPYANAVRETSKALQARIQGLILNEALVDRDAAVPPGYKELVEDYFRVLSEDVR